MSFLTHARKRSLPELRLYRYLGVVANCDRGDEVPLDSSANVSLAGHNSGPIEVGSGRHHWSYPYQLPDVTYPPLTLDSTLRELIDSPEAYALVLSIIPQHYPAFMARMQDQTEVTLRQAICSNPRTEKLGPQIDASLASLGQ